MDAIFNILSATVPVLLALRTQVTSMLNLHETQVLFFDLLLLAAIGVGAGVFWCCCLQRSGVWAFAVRILTTAFFFLVAVVSTYLLAVMWQVMKTEHPDWPEKATAAASSATQNITALVVSWRNSFQK